MLNFSFVFLLCEVSLVQNFHLMKLLEKCSVGCYLAAHLLGLQILVVIRKRLRELPFEGSKFFQ